MENDRHSLEKFEKKIPDRVSSGLRSAYKAAINSGEYVIVSRHGNIVRIGPNLKEHVVGKTRKSIRVQKGHRIKIQ